MRNIFVLRVGFKVVKYTICLNWACGGDGTMRDIFVLRVGFVLGVGF